MASLTTLRAVLSWVTHLYIVSSFGQAVGATISLEPTSSSSVISDSASLTSSAHADTTSISLSTDSENVSLTSVPTATSSAMASDDRPKVHLVRVGAGGFNFKPAQLTGVSVGDVVTFEFYPLDHSVARAEYGSACVPYEYTGKDKIGFWSETQWVHTVEEITHWNLTINSTEPIFFYCAAPNSCKGELMVGAINPNSTQTLDAQIRAANAADYPLAPGDPIPREASPTLVAPSRAIDHHGAKFSGGAIAGIVIGGVVFLAICAWFLFYLLRRKAVEKDIRREAPATSGAPLPALINYSESYPVSPMASPTQHSSYTFSTHPHPTSYSYDRNRHRSLPAELGPGTKE